MCSTSFRPIALVADIKHDIQESKRYVKRPDFDSCFFCYCQKKNCSETSELDFTAAGTEEKSFNEA